MSTSSATANAAAASPGPPLPPLPNALAKQQLERSGGRKLGTLVVVVIKARNLPNKQRIGKQDPYCSVSLGHQKNKTQAVKRGGQTPHWDAQLEFEVWEQRGDEQSIVATESGGIAPIADDADLPNQATVGRAKAKTAANSKKILKIACYADDPREPELIGEAELDYSDTLKKGEFDEWVELKYRGKYAGEVFMEMTFYSAAPPPVKRKSKPAIPGSGYGGPGHFEPLPVSISQSPSASPAKARPVSTSLTASAFQQQHPLRTSQSNYSLGSTSAVSSATVTEFGARPTSLASMAFPIPEHQGYPHGSTSSGSSLQQPPPHSLRPHRASFSSYGMTQHDIDSLTRPLSSLSIGSVNKPLPMPQAPAGQGQLGPSAFVDHQGPMDPRPQSGQAYPRPPSAQASYQPQYSQSPHPQSYSPAPPAQTYSPAPPAPQYHHNAPHHHEDPRPDFPQTPHRHSLSTYNTSATYPPDEPAFSNWNNAQIQSLPPEQDQNIIGLHRPPSTSWQDPRGPSPLHQHASPQLNGNRHPVALQPGLLSPSASASGFPQSPPPPVRQNGFTPPLPPRSPVYPSHDQYSQPPPVHGTSPALAHHPQVQDQYAAYQPEHEAANQHTSTYQRPQQYDAYNAQQVPDYGQQQPYYDATSHQPMYEPSQHEQPYYNDQQPQQAYHQPPSHQQQTYSPAPPPLPHQVSNEAYRSNSPYRPLPQPTPESSYQQGPSSSQYAQQPPYQEPGYQEPPYQAQPYQENYSAPYQAPAPPQQHLQGAYQPRFGLPPHQPYDQPYYGNQQAPPPLPPVPQELRHDDHQQQHRYNQYY